MKEDLKTNYLYIQVYRDLREQILNGTFTQGALLPSEREIRELYHVERTTVRKALQKLVDEGLAEKKPGIGTQVKGKEPVSGEELSSSQKNGKVAFFLNSNERMIQPFYSALFYSLEVNCRKAGYQLVMSALSEQENFEAILDDEDYSCIIFASNLLPEYFEVTRSRRMPAVLINKYHEALPCILPDNVRGMYLVTDYLLGLGHRKIGIIKGRTDYTSTEERMWGCLAACANRGVTPCRDWIIESDFNQKSGYEAMKSLMDRCTGKDRPTAVIAFSDSMLSGILKAAAEYDLRVPEDLSVTGFDHLSETGLFLQSFTTVEANVDILAKVAVDTLLHQIESYPEYSSKIVTQVELVIGSSTDVPCS
ncbi:MAG: GntR family transcriptional regulator [Hungatella sp.]|jgi:LacI family transcriptional regulator|nr:GntR family transcriptional regulator [Hungatella sp.]